MTYKIENPALSTLPETDLALEQYGEKLLEELSSALASWKKYPEESVEKLVLNVLNKIGEILENHFAKKKVKGFDGALYNKSADRFELYFASGTSGYRIFINMHENEAYPFHLIYPNAGIATHSITGMSFPTLFKQLFSDRAINVNSGAVSPYYIVALNKDKDESEKV